MRTIKELPIIQDNDLTKFPDGQIVNETAIKQGSPVVREIYGDIIQNIYKVLRDSGIEPNQIEDSELTEYQFVEALKRFSNSLNDLQQVLTIDNIDDEIGTLLHLDTLPENYIFIGKLSENIVANKIYTLSGLDSKSFNTTSEKDVLASSLVIVVLSINGSKITEISNSSVIDESIDISLGSPLPANSSNKILYLANGRILDNFPSSFNVQQIINDSLLTNNLSVLNAVYLKGKLLCFTYNRVTESSQIFAFTGNNLSNLEGEVVFPKSTNLDRFPFIYSDGEFVYFTNTVASFADSLNDNDLAKFSFNENNLTMSLQSASTLNASFLKSTNCFINSGLNLLYSFVNGQLNRYGISNGQVDDLGLFEAINGQVFRFNGKTYFSNGYTASKWNY